MEQLSFISKTRFVTALGLAAVLFGFIALPLARPEIPGGTLLLVQHARPVPAVMVVALLALLTPAVALLCPPILRYITALAAAPIGLAVLALWTAGLDPALARLSVENRPQLFHAMLIDLLLWCGVVWLSILAARLMVKGEMRELITPVPVDDKPIKKPSLQAVFVNTILGIVGVVILSYLLLRIFVQSGQVQISVSTQMSPPPDKGQIVFGLIAAFGLATLAVHQIFALRVEWLLLSVVIVAVGVLTVMRPTDTILFTILVPTCVPSSQLLTTITPISWAAFGSLGVLWGYWTSLKIRGARENLIETIA